MATITGNIFANSNIAAATITGISHDASTLPTGITVTLDDPTSGDVTIQTDGTFTNFDTKLTCVFDIAYWVESPACPCSGEVTACITVASDGPPTFTDEGCAAFEAACGLVQNGGTLSNDFDCDLVPSIVVNNASGPYFDANCAVDLFTILNLLASSGQAPDGFTGCTLYVVAQDGAGRQVAIVFDYAANPPTATVTWWDTDGTVLLELTYTDNTSAPPYDPGFDTYNFGNSPTVTGGTLQACVDTNEPGPQIQIN